MMIAEQDSSSPEPRQAHILRLVPKASEEPRRVSAPEKLYAALEAACEACALQLNEASITVAPAGFEVIRSRAAADAEGDENRNAFALMESDKGPFALVESEPDTVIMVVSALLGAEPEAEPVALQRPLSAAEWDFLSIIADDLRTLLAAASIPQAESCVTELLHKGPNDAQCQAVTPGVKLMVTLNWGPQTGLLSVTLPLGLVEKIFAEPVVTSAAAKNASWGLRLKRTVGQAPVRVSAVMPVGTRTLGQIRKLGVGDILDLSSLGELQKILLTANGHTLFTAELGKVGKVYSARVLARHAHPAKPGET